MPNHKSYAYQKPTFNLPKQSVNLQRWAVIACDQFTSQPAYWEEVETLVGDAPSTYRMILPEAYLDTPRGEEHARQTYEYMRSYMVQGIFDEYSGYVYIERKLGSKTRRGLLLNLDLEQYDFNKGSTTLIRATEGTILDRLPPRIKIREEALLEIPHIMVLIDDREDKLFAFLKEHNDAYKKIYDFELMQNSGALKGFLVDQQGEGKIKEVFANLCDPHDFKQRYNLSKDLPLLLFAVGDGNHSLATAKSIWDKIKNQVPPDHPARFALVEVINIHDESLVFEPIHRALFNCTADIVDEMRTYFGNSIDEEKTSSFMELQNRIHNETNIQQVGLIQPQGYMLVKFLEPTTNLVVGTLQQFLDDHCKTHPQANLDYVHGDEVVHELGSKPGNIGFLLPAMQKNDLFRTVILDGSLPRKTFSMGDAREKRFYLECREIQ
ncbi:MAG: DUF1015 domain-containing protein [Chloroflexi bacterium]|nr:DUF1015 domain-containing protein [Chloroflexota bacterium]